MIKRAHYGFIRKSWPSYLIDHGPAIWSEARPGLTLIVAPAHVVLRKPVPQLSLAFPALNDNCTSDKDLDQFYTRPDLAARYYRIFREHFDPNDFLMVEPSAGQGSFFKLLPNGSVGIDLEPKYPGILTGDFLTMTILSERKVAFIGNPPYGKNSRLAVRFFNHAARQGDVLAFILPLTFRKTCFINLLDDDFHLIYEEPVPPHAFLFKGTLRTVPAVFQIWVRRDARRASLPAVKTHPDFEFTTADRANFAIQRVGKNAGRVHHEFTRSRNAHYFIRGNVEGIMKSLRSEFAAAAANTAGNPSLAMSEIVSIYSERIFSPSQPEN